MFTQLTVKCSIIGHASPRWRGAGSDAHRVQLNEILGQKRAESILKEFELNLSQSLGNYKLNFIENVEYPDDFQPDQSALIGTESVGQREAFKQSGNNRTNDDAQYRRVDVVVKIARSNQESVPTKVIHQYNRPTSDKFWYASVGISGSIDAVVGFNILRVKIRNTKGDEASGIVNTVSAGVGLKYSFSPYSWTDEASFHVPGGASFGDFNGRPIRFSNLSFVLGFGYARSYLTFYGMGQDAASLHVGGWQTGLSVSADLSLAGMLILDSVPSNYKIERYAATEWNEIRSDWRTEQKVSVHFATESWQLNSVQKAQIREFADKVANDVRSS
jgi:hypothetical protein